LAGKKHGKEWNNQPFFSQQLKPKLSGWSRNHSIWVKIVVGLVLHLTNQEFEKAMLTRFFKLKRYNTSLRTELIAGVTTFMTMAYILVANPAILSETGMDKDALFVATALASIIGTLVMAFYANLPFGLAPGMGLNAFFAYSVVSGMGYSWQFALTAVFIEGIIFILLTMLNVRQAIVDAIPLNMKHAVSSGIGLFIALIGLNNAGIIQSSDETLVTLGSMTSPSAYLAFMGMLVIGLLLALKVRGAILIGIIAVTVTGIPAGITEIPENFTIVSAPPSIQPLFFQFDFSDVFTLDMLIVLFTFLFVDMFDTVGTLVGVGTKANMMDQHGKLPRINKALFADACGTFFGAIFGTSTTTTYVESASGIAEGGRTGMTALTIAVLFALSLFLAPLFIIVPDAATAPALIIVGLFMITPVQKINFDESTEAIPAFITIIMMPLTYSISEGIVFGLLSYVFLKLATGKFKDLNLFMILLAGLFLIKIIVDR
jgi:AGZA family xanthine/uracil permease-like MFS transporter